MRILFLNPPHKFRISRCSRWPENTKSGTLYYPYWLAYATGLLMDKGYEVLLLDAIAKGWDFKQTIKRIKRFNPDLTVLETVTPTFYSDMKFVSELKGEIDTKVCVVGTHVSVFPKETLKKYDVDFVAIKEYDYTVLDLAKALEAKEQLKNVKGICYKKDGIHRTKERELVKNIDSLPFVSQVYKKFLNIEDYRYSLARHPMIQVWSARGCPNMCTFCQYPQVFSNRVFRARSSENFVDELEWIKENLPQVKEIFIEDDTMTVDKKRTIRICELIKERKLDILWSANLRADVPRDVLKQMKSAGFRMAIVGYESGNQEILKTIKKGILLDRAIKFTSDAKKLGIMIFGCFMVGLPGETKETINQTLDYAKKLNPDMAFFQQLVPFPGTELYSWLKKNNYILTEKWDDWLDDDGRLKFLVNYPNLSAEEMKKLRDEITIKFYKSPRWVLQAIMHNLHPQEMIRLTKAGLDYIKFLRNQNSGV